MINSLTVRIFAIFWVALALVLMLVLFAPQLDARKMTGLLKNDLNHAHTLEKNIEYTLSQTPLMDFLWQQRLSSVIRKLTPQGQYLLLVTNEGKIIGLKNNQVYLIRIARNFIGQSYSIDAPKKKKYGQIELLGPFPVQDQKEQYQLYLVRPARSLQSDFINLLFDKPLLLLLATMLVSSPLLLWLSWSLAKPARKLQLAADAVAKGSLKADPDLESGPIEFRATGISFNQMITSLERMMTAQQRLISDVSHELRTPLTRLQLATALMRRRSGSSKELKRIETEAQRLESMINDLLLLSRSRYKSELKRQYLKISEIWKETLENAHFEAEQAGKSLNIISQPLQGTIYGNQSSLESALENIIRNALRHAKNNIEITFNFDHNSLLIYVDDDGPGVEEQDLEQLFHPFYRTDEARDRTSGGTGLGLAIVESAISQHQGWVKAENSPLGGLRLTLWLPLQHT